MQHIVQRKSFQYGALAALAVAFAYYVGFVFDFGYEFQWDVLFSRNETYDTNFGLELLKAVGLTIKISAISALFALTLGTFFGLARLANFRPLRWTAVFYVEFFRNTPLLVQLFFWYFALPAALPESAREFIFAHDFEFWTATIGLSLYTGSFMAEVIRAGLQSIPKGLLEAAYSSGLTYLQVLRKIILPLAFRAIIPPLGSEVLNNMKNSSLAMVVGVAELTWQSQQVESLTFRGFEATTAATVLYLSLSLVISFVLNTINSRMQLEPSKKGSYLDRVVSLPAVPLQKSARAFRKQLERMRKRKALGPDALVLSDAAALRRKILAQAGKLAVLLAKAAFLGFIALVLYKVGQGLASFDWNVVWKILPTLLVWRFPMGGEGELFYGLGGLSFSLIMAVIAISVSFFIGLFVGVGRTADNPVFRIPSMMYIEIIRGNPLIIVIFWVYFFIPVVTGAFFDVFWSATIALTIFTGAYIAEIVRAGIQNVPPGQREAAISTGLSYTQYMRKIILPQALKQMIPAIVGQFIAIFKDTSLAYVIGVLELTFVAQGLNNRLMVHPFEIYTTVAVLYFVFCYGMSIYAARLERRLSPERVRLQM